VLVTATGITGKTRVPTQTATKIATSMRVQAYGVGPDFTTFGLELPMDSSRLDLSERVRVLEAQLRVTRRLGLLALTAAIVVAATRIVTASGDPSAKPSGVLHVRGLVVEDAAGHPRLLLGAPIPKLPIRRRADEITGLVLMASNGADRLQLGEVGDPQMGGRLQQRSSRGTGLVVNDSTGDERGGFGVFENGQVGWGLDYQGHEGLVAAVIPERKMAGIVLSCGEEKGQRIAFYAKPGGASVELNDSTGTTRVSLATHGAGPPTLHMLDSKGTALLDLFAGATKR